MKLRELLKFHDIVIQCHDNPDADALASGFAVYMYLKEKGKNPRFIYGGRTAVRKSNLVMMIRELEIPVEHVRELDPPELLVTVDCQYGEGNVTYFEAKNVAVFDHHRVNGKLPAMNEVRSSLGACSTLIWQLLKEEGFEVNENPKLATALYYGLYTDTNEFTEIYHPLDKDLRDMADFSPHYITKFRNANLSIEELEVAGSALLRTDYIEEFRLAIVKAGPCDPNILGIISDLVLEVDAVDICLVFNVNPHGVKLSLRSCVKEVQASELAEEICKGLGSGGGHHVKAGGFLDMERVIPEYTEFCKTRNIIPRMVYGQDGETQRPSDSAIKAVIERRLVDYFEHSQIINAKDSDLDTSDMELYFRKPMPVGYVKGTDIFKAGTSITLRTMQGDIDTKIEEDTIIIIGIKGEIFLSRENNFRNRYRTYQWPFSLKHAEYNPTVKENSTGVSIPLMQYANVCVPTGQIKVRAKKLDHNVKLFTEWDETKYMRGHVGDYLIQRSDDNHDITTMDGKLFEECYAKVSDLEEENVQAVVFDLDGTLLDTLEDLTNAVNFGLTSRGLPPRTIDEVRQFVGNGVEKLMVRAVPEGRDNPAFEGAFADFRRYYQEHCLDCTKPYPDILNMMRELKARGIKMAIVSNKMDSAVKELSRGFFPDYVSVSIGDREGMKRKPAPDAVNKALEELGVAPEKALYVGDSDVDIETAKNAGLRCISVSWGFRDADFLRQHGATDIADKPIELLYMI